MSGTSCLFCVIHVTWPRTAQKTDSWGRKCLVNYIELHINHWFRFTYQAVKEVHHDNDDEEDEGEKKEVPDGRLDRQVAELQLTYEHGERLHHGEVEGVEERVVVGRFL